jgi:serine/threonine protein kinase/CheY-like chemotaxis protein
VADEEPKARIVIAEDSEVVRMAVSRLLTRKGFEVSEHPDGQAALEAVHADPPDLVLSDIQMPRLDGLDLTRELRKKFDKRSLPIVLISVLSEEEDIVSGLEAGANDYLVKPYRNAELLAKVSVLLRERETHRKPTEPTLPMEPSFAPANEGPGSEESTQVIKKKPDQGGLAYYFDKYQVNGEYGRGGMGTVYRAIRRDDDMPVALKVLAPRLSGNRTAIARFLREIRALSSLNSEHVVEVLDHGYDAGRYFLVMEAVEGDSLDQIVLRDGPLDQLEAARLFREVALALQSLFDEGLIHRDVKPSNIIRRNPDGFVKLVDFGLAKYENEASELTESGYALGTSFYVAPEVIEGAHADAQSDLFSLGVSVFEALTGRRPFTGVVPYQIFKRIVSGPVPDPTTYRRDLAPGLAAIVGKLLKRDPAERHQSGTEVAQELQDWLETDEAKALKEQASSS